MDREEVVVSLDVFKAAEAFDQLVWGEGFQLAEVIEECYRRSGSRIVLTV